MSCLFLIIIFPAQSQNSLCNLQFSEALHDFPAARSMLTSSYLHAAFRNDFCTKEMMFKELFLFNNREQLTFFEQKVWKNEKCSLVLHRSK